MASSTAPRDPNFVPAAMFENSSSTGAVLAGQINPITGRILVDLASGGSGTVTSVSVVTANGLAGSVANSTTTPAITLSTTITGILKGNGTAISAASAGTDYVAVGAITTSGLTMSTAKMLGRATAGTGSIEEIAVTGSGNAVLATSPVLTTPNIGVATATSVNKVFITAPSTSATLTIADGKTLTINDNITIGTGGITLGNTGGFTAASSKVLTANNSITLAGTDGTTITFPSTSASAARTDAAQTFTGTQTFTQVITTNNAINASGNAATIPVTSKINTVTNNSAAAMTLTLTTSGAVDRQQSIVCVLDASAATQGITWVNTENSTVTAPTVSNGSTTNVLTVGFMYNNASSKWRCVASA